MIGKQYGSVARPQVRRAAFTDAFNAAEVRAVRPEDKNARQIQQAFANGATLADLEQHIAFLRSLGAPDDAHPKIGVNDDYEITMRVIRNSPAQTFADLHPIVSKVLISARRA